MCRKVSECSHSKFIASFPGSSQLLLQTDTGRSLGGGGGGGGSEIGRKEESLWRGLHSLTRAWGRSASLGRRAWSLGTRL